KVLLLAFFCCISLYIDVEYHRKRIRWCNMKLKYKSSLFVIKAAIIAFFATLPMFFQLEVNSFQEICKYLGVKNDIHILDSYLNKIRFLIGDFLMSFDGSSVAFLVIFIIFICIYLKFNSIAD